MIIRLGRIRIIVVKEGETIEEEGREEGAVGVGIMMMSGSAIVGIMMTTMMIITITTRMRNPRWMSLVDLR